MCMHAPIKRSLIPMKNLMTFYVRVCMHTSIKKMSRKQIKLNLKPWITNKIIKMMHHRDKLFLKWNKNRVNTHTHNTYEQLLIVPNKRSGKAKENIIIISLKHTRLK